MKQKALSVESAIVYYFLLTIYFGKPFVKLTFIPNSNFYFVTIFVVLLIAKYSIDLVFSFKKNKKLLVSEYMYFVPLIYIVVNFLLLDSYSFDALKKYMIILSISLIFLIYNNRSLISKKLDSIVAKHNTKATFLGLLLLVETILAKSGTYGLIFWSTPFISQNIFDFKPQRIFLAIIFTYLIFKRGKSTLLCCLLILNISLLVTYSRIVFVMFIVSILLYAAIYKNIKMTLTAFFLVVFLVLSGFVDIFGMFLNQNLVDSEGKKFIAAVCAEHLDDGVSVNKASLKNNYLVRNVDYGEYPTLPRYFSASNILETFNLYSYPDFLNKGKENICKDYFRFLNESNDNIEFCNLDNSGICTVTNRNPLLYTSNAQSAQLAGNLNFRINLWSSTLSKISESYRTLFFGLGVDKPLPIVVDPSTNYGNLWHAHGSIISLLGFFGFTGFLIYLISLLFILLRKEEFNINFLIIFSNLILLSLSDAVIETPDLSFIFVFVTGLLKK